MSRRYSADDAEATSSAAENESVLSDVESNFKVSPKIRPVTFKKTRLRKRLMSAKSSVGGWEPKSKRSLVERTISCPAEPNTVEPNRQSKAKKSTEVDDPSINSPTEQSPDPTPPNTTRLKPASTSSVSRRTAVLFKKKPRRETSLSSTSNSYVQDNVTPVMSPTSDSATSGAAECDASDSEVGTSQNPKTSSSTSTPNGFNSTYGKLNDLIT